MLLRTAKRVVVFVIGTTVVLMGVAMLVLPGPATRRSLRIWRS